MNRETMEARRRLRGATRAEFERMVYEAMLTPTQEKVLRLHIAEDLSVCCISMRLSCSETFVRNRLFEAYKKVSKLKGL